MRPYVVAAEVGGHPDPCAHALPDLGDLTGSHGVALCGYPAEHLTVLPGLAWTEVRFSHRCEHCHNTSAAAAEP